MISLNTKLSFVSNLLQNRLVTLDENLGRSLLQILASIFLLTRQRLGPTLTHRPDSHIYWIHAEGVPCYDADLIRTLPSARRFGQVDHPSQLKQEPAACGPKLARRR